MCECVPNTPCLCMSPALGYRHEQSLVHTWGDQLWYITRRPDVTFWSASNIWVPHICTATSLSEGKPSHPFPYLDIMQALTQLFIPFLNMCSFCSLVTTSCPFLEWWCCLADSFFLSLSLEGLVDILSEDYLIFQFRYFLPGYSFISYFQPQHINQNLPFILLPRSPSK